MPLRNDRYDQNLLSDHHWAQIRRIVPHPDALTFDTRMFVEVVLWCVQSGSRWRHLQNDYYSEVRWNTVHRRYALWERMFGVLEGDPAFRFRIVNGRMTPKAGNVRSNSWGDGRELGLRVRPEKPGQKMKKSVPDRQ